MIEKLLVNLYNDTTQDDQMLQKAILKAYVKWGTNRVFVALDVEKNKWVIMKEGSG